MFPVVFDPRVRVEAFVVPRVPSPLMYVELLPLFAEIDAVGVPELMLRTANLADGVELDPRRKSWFPILSKIDPLADSNGEPPFDIGRIPLTSVVRDTEENVGVVPPWRT